MGAGVHARILNWEMLYQIPVKIYHMVGGACGLREYKFGHNVACANGVIVRRSVNRHDLLPPSKLAYRVIRSSLKIMGNV